MNRILKYQLFIFSASGVCRWSDNTQTTFKMEFTIGNLPAYYNAFAIVDSATDTLLSTGCFLLATNNYFSKDIDSGALTTCGIQKIGVSASGTP